MSAIAIEPTGNESYETTLLALVSWAARGADSDEEILATVNRVLDTGRARLMGNFVVRHIRVSAPGPRAND